MSATQPLAGPREAPVRIAVMGTADIARRRMLPAMAAAPGTALVAVASRDRDRAAALARDYGCAAVEGYQELLERPGVDAVYVPLPVALHAEWVERALLAGKHVLAEKPLTADPARTSALLTLARERGLVLMENVMFLHHPQHAVVRELLGSGAIGELRSFSAAFAVPPPPPGNIRHRPDLGGGALLDIGYYPVRAALHFLGAEVEVVGACLEYGPGSAVDTSGAVLVRTPAGVTGHLTFGMAHAYRSAYELWGSEGTIRVEPAFTPPADHQPVLRVTGPAERRELRLSPHDQVAGTLRAFVRAVRSGTGGAPRGARSLRQAELLDAVRRTAGARRPGPVAAPPP
ncbi:gfo/Idh/MocA family oxidoreductase [Streptomyces sp. BG9H]|uniref:Glycosyl hydrolase family 109 protein n=1 Tax=Streptomyces anatolicus TaxID=2675858 RepID=A0ABS6YTP5_9ACTN|nr:Gfo/Idh/MocA family oxidoreductase [Streptomyces anatolicus]MBW5424808.1 gfo/Idh/MocA family oxidoreductase [Streptomyces anatolicus]